MTLSVALSHRQGDFTLDLSFRAPPGLTVLFGPSGAGKTTVVQAVAGLLRPDAGRIALGDEVLFDQTAGRFLPPHRRRIGYVFQDGRLFPHLTVRQNLLYGRWFAPRGAAGESLDRVVALLGIGELLGRRPAGLSGGEKARVALGRALLSAPRLILADEPLAALDEARKAEILPYFERLRDEVAIPILYVSHSTAEVARLATTVVALRQGRLAAIGPPDAVLGSAAATDPQDILSLLPVRLVAHHPDGLSELASSAGPLWLPQVAASPGSLLRLRIAAQDVILARARPDGLSALNILPGRILDIAPAPAAACLVTLALGPAGDRLIARLTRRSAEAMGLAPGMDCHAVVKTAALAPGSVGAAPRG